MFEFLLVKQLTNDNKIASKGKKTCKLESVMPRNSGMYEVSFKSPNMLFRTSTPWINNDNKRENRAALSILSWAKIFIFRTYYNCHKF